jgi:hypothetical protein
MRVQLRVRRLSAAHSPGRGVTVGGCDHVLRVLFHHLSAVATAHHWDPLLQVFHRPLDRLGVRFLDLVALPRVPQCPHDRHRLGGAERHVDPTAAGAVGARGAQPRTAARVASFHQRGELGTVDRGIRVDPQPGKRLAVRQPTARRLGQVPVGRQVVVALLRRDRLALQIAGVAATPARADAGCAHHMM